MVRFDKLGQPIREGDKVLTKNGNQYREYVIKEFFPGQGRMASAKIIFEGTTHTADELSVELIGPPL